MGSTPRSIRKTAGSRHGSPTTSWRFGCRRRYLTRSTWTESRRPRRTLYGLDRPETATFGRQCLTARRLVEQGGSLRPDLFRRLGQSRLPRAGAFFPNRERRSTDRGTHPGSQGARASRRDARHLDGRIRPDAGQQLPRWRHVARPRAQRRRDEHRDGGRRRAARSGSWRDGTTSAPKRSTSSTRFATSHVTILHLLGPRRQPDSPTFHGGRFKQLSQFGGRVIRELIGVISGRSR